LYLKRDKEQTNKDQIVAYIMEQNKNTQEISNTGSQDSSRSTNNVLEMLKKNALYLFIGVTILFVVVFIIIWAVRPAPAVHMANQFCTCVNNTSELKYEQSRDGFGYATVLNTCIGADFTAFSEGKSANEREYFLLDFKEAVKEKCPENLSKVFEYK
jgi:hypothetical protein